MEPFRRRPAPPRPGPHHPGIQPGPLRPTEAAQFTDQLRRQVINFERCQAQLRRDEAADRLARQQGRCVISSGLQRYLNELRTPFSPAWTAAHAHPTAVVGPAATPYEKLRAHVYATNSGPIANMILYDPVLRSVAVAGAAVTGAVLTTVAAPVVYEAGETVAMQSIERGAIMLEQQGATLAAQWRAVTLGSFATKGIISAVGQGLGNYWVERDAWVAVKKINILSALASGINLPLGYNSLLSAGFNVSGEGVKTILPSGGITAYEFKRDALFNYGFGKLASGFRIPGMAGRQWVGLDKLHGLVTTNPKVEQGIGFTLYNAYIRFGPRISYGLGVGAATLTTGLEHGNKVAVGATKKYLSKQVKNRFPDPNKSAGHGR